MLLRRCNHIAAALAVGLTATAQEPTSTQPVATTQPPPYIEVESEVFANVLNQQIGSHTVADLSFPREFVETIADRVIQSTYQERYRTVVRDPGMTTRPAAAPRSPRTSTQPVERSEFAIRQNPLHGTVREVDRWRNWGERRPPLPGFRICATEPNDWFSAIEFAGSASPAQHDTAGIIAKALAREGVVMAAARGILALGPQQFGADRNHDDRKLAENGLPSDLLRFFYVDGRDEPIDPKWIAARLTENAAIDNRFSSSAFEFRFAPSYPGFVVTSEDGRAGRRALRLQMTRGDDWLGPNDGSGLDILRQISRGLSETPLVVHVESCHLGPLVETMRTWNLSNPERIVLLSEDMTVSQWAGDNAKNGSAAVASKSLREFVTLVPRFASRGEDGPVFVPGDTRLLASLAATGRRVICSPLLFQGGNLIAVRLKDDGGVVLLTGEAEIYRNVALGLTPDQAAEALRIEFGAERLEVLPAASFHIDYELTIRTRGRDTVAFVNDSHAACVEIIRIGIEAIRRGGQISVADATRAAQLIRTEKFEQLFDLLAPAIGALAVRSGQFAESNIAAFSVSEVDSAVGNFQRFLFALDFELARAHSSREASADGHTQAYFRSLRRMETRQRELQRRVTTLGLTVYSLPSLSADRLSVNYVNAVQTNSHMLVPAYGGLFGPLDLHAERLIRGAVEPSVRVFRVNCAESQRRGGALHCSIGVE